MNLYLYISFLLSYINNINVIINWLKNTTLVNICNYSTRLTKLSLYIYKKYSDIQAENFAWLIVTANLNAFFLFRFCMPLKWKKIILYVQSFFFFWMKILAAFKSKNIIKSHYLLSDSAFHHLVHLLSCVCLTLYV